MNWHKEKYFEGAYSFPTPNEKLVKFYYIFILRILDKKLKKVLMTRFIFVERRIIPVFMVPYQGP